MQECRASEKGSSTP